MANNIYRESAILWIKNNTTFDVSVEQLPPNVELFIEKFTEFMSVRLGIASESISGLSHSFSTAEVKSTLKQYAEELIGSEYMRSDLKAFPALDRWTY